MSPVAVEARREAGAMASYLYDRGGMRRVHLRLRENILKRLVVDSDAANLGLLMRTLFGRGTPRGFQGRLSRVISRCGTASRYSGRHGVAHL
jgi:hypothetical protein